MEGIEPTVPIAALEALLTGRALEENLQETLGLTIAERDRGELVVVRLTDTLQAALAHASDDELAVAVDRWAQTEEFWGQGDPAILRPQVRELAEIARNAAQQGLRLYCWLCL
jgi:hypothetical protein